MKRRVFMSIAVAAALLPLQPAQAQETRGVYKDRIVFGQQTDLSGVIAVTGIDQSNAIRMRFDEANQKGGVHGRRLELIVEDSGYQVPKAVQAVNKLIHRDKVFAIIGSMGTNHNMATLPEQLKNNVPNLFPNSAAKMMYEPFHKLKFAALVTYYDMARTGAKWLAETKGVKKLCLAYMRNDYGDETLQGATDQLKTMGLAVHQAVGHRPTDVDFSATMLKLKESGCDGIMTASMARDTVGILNAVKSMKWDVPVVGGGAAQQMVVSEAAGNVAEGFYVMSPVLTAYPDDSNKAAAEWVKRYTERYKQAPSVYSQWAYGWADMVVIALEKAGRDLTLDRFIAALESIKDYQDPFGSPKQSFGPDKRLGSNQMFMAQVKNGRWIRATGNLSY